jgi:hypothetical protein
MPTAYMGLVTDSPVSAPVAAQPVPTTPTPAEIVAQAKQAAAMSNGSDLYNKAIELAKTAKDFPSFLSTALSDPDIIADDELAVQCADQSQVWAAAH